MQPLLVTSEQARAIAELLAQWAGADKRTIVKTPSGFSIRLPPPPPGPAAGGAASDPSPVIWVRVKGGSPSSDGDDSSAADIAYDIYSFTIDGTMPAENLIDESIDLEPARSIGLRTAAADGSPGIAYQDDDGVWWLIAVFGEIEGAISCA